MNSSSKSFTEFQLNCLEQAFHVGAEDASTAMAQWLGVPSLIAIEAVDQLSIEEAPDILGGSEQPICFCSMAMTGTLTGTMVFVFDDECGLSLADLVLHKPVGTASDWNELERSSALESTNIVGCAYLNSLSRHLPAADSHSIELIPSPPTFRRDFAECLLQSVFMEQAMVANDIFLAEARFEISGEPLNWTLLFVPDAPSLAQLRRLLPDSD